MKSQLACCSGLRLHNPGRAARAARREANPRPKRRICAEKSQRLTSREASIGGTADVVRALEISCQGGLSERNRRKGPVLVCAMFCRVHHEENLLHPTGLQVVVRSDILLQHDS